MKTDQPPISPNSIFIGGWSPAPYEKPISKKESEKTPQGKFLPPRREIFILKRHFLFPLGPWGPGGGGKGPGTCRHPQGPKGPKGKESVL